jgi:hypothetical protein
MTHAAREFAEILCHSALTSEIALIETISRIHPRLEEPRPFSEPDG